MNIKRITLSTLLAVGLLFGAKEDPTSGNAAPTAGSRTVTVYVSAKGKTYHTNRDCGTLRRSKTVLQASEHDAQVHGLTLCSICAHRRHAGVIDGDNANWAHPEQK